MARRKCPRSFGVWKSSSSSRAGVGVDPAQAQAEEGPDPLASFDPRKVPALDLSIDKLYRGDDLYGSAAIKLRPTPRGVTASDIDLDLKGLRIDGGGGWEGETGKTSRWYKGRLDGKNLADVLKAWNFAPSGCTVASAGEKLPALAILR